MNSMLILEVLWNGEVVCGELVPKESKRSNSGQNHEVVPVPKQGGTGTTQQNLIGTGTEQSGTDTIVSKMPRLCSFA